MTRSVFILPVLFMALLFHVSLSQRMWESRAEVRSELGGDYVLPSQFSRILALGYHGLFSDYLFLKVATFYGERQVAGRELNESDWHYFIRGLDVVTDLDPYFFDPYLLAEGHLAWAGKAEEATTLLEKGRKFRDFDWRIPFFIGFNYFYFHQKHEQAAEYIIEAARLPGSPEFLPTLGARLAYYGGKTGTGIAFLEDILQQTKNPALRNTIELRLATLRKAALLESFLDRYRKEQGRAPERITDLVAAGYIDALPEEPYGGEWVIMKSGRVFSTSKFVQVNNKGGAPAASKK